MRIIFSNRQNKITVNKELKKLIINCIKKAVELENIPKNWEVSVSFVDNDKIRVLNKTYRNIDKETDVLSFPLVEDFNLLGDNPQAYSLGDIVISLEKAKEQSLEYGHSFEREVAFLTVHSMYHLFGYDHETEVDAKIMREKEESVLQNLGIIR